MSLEWTNERIVVYKDCQFKLFTSKHTDGSYYATLLYYQRKSAMQVIAEDLGTLEFYNQTYWGKTEEDAINAVKKWMDEKFPKAKIGKPNRRI